MGKLTGNRTNPEVGIAIFNPTLGFGRPEFGHRYPHRYAGLTLFTVRAIDMPAAAAKSKF
jgi:hypothetical protein